MPHSRCRGVRTDPGRGAHGRISGEEAAHHDYPARLPRWAVRRRSEQHSVRRLTTIDSTGGGAFGTAIHSRNGSASKPTVAQQSLLDRGDLVEKLDRAVA